MGTYHASVLVPYPSGRTRLKSEYCFLNNVTRFVKLLFVDHERWGKSNFIAVRWLGQQAVVFQLQTDFPGGFVPEFRALGNHDGVE